MSLTPAPRKFLVIDDNADSRTLLTRTLLRKFPDSVAVECENGDTAVAMLRTERLCAVIAHRTFDYDGETLIGMLRKADPEVPIVMVSGYDRRRVSNTAGADAFMDYGAWLTIGNVVADVLAAREKKSKSPVAAKHPDSLAEPEPV